MKTFDELMVELVEKKAVSLQTRRKMALRMKKLARSSAFKAKVARKKMKLATPEMLHKRALKKAKMFVIQKYAGHDAASWNALSPAARMEIDQRITAKKGVAIQKIAKKMMMKMKKAEVERLRDLKIAKAEGSAEQ
jgi:hypothetical protein